MEGLADFTTHTSAGAILVLYKNTVDLETALGCIADHWMLFEIRRHFLYKMADSKTDPWNESVRFVAFEYSDQAKIRFGKYDQIIMLNPDLIKYPTILDKVPDKWNREKFYLVFEYGEVVKYLENKDCNLQVLTEVLKLADRDEKAELLKKRKYIIKEGGEQDGDDDDE